MTDLLACGVTLSPTVHWSGLSSIHLCAATILVQYIQLINQSVHIKLQLHNSIPVFERKEIGPYFETSVFRQNRNSQYQNVFFNIYICVFLYMHKQQMCFHDWGGECFSFTSWVATGWLLCDLWWNGTVYHKSQTGELFFTHKYFSTLTFVHSWASSTEKKWSNHGLFPISGPPCPHPIALTHTCTCAHP